MYNQGLDFLLDGELREECGIFGIAGCPDAAVLTREGLYSLQHRGQESTGMFVRTPDGCLSKKGMGLVADVFRQLPDSWWNGPQDMAIGHVRYSTSGASSLVNAQPFAVDFDDWHLALAHNGTLSNAYQIRNQLKTKGALFQGTTDTELILHLAAHSHEQGQTPWEALRTALINCQGAYSLLALCEDGMLAARDPYGFRPLCIGKRNDCIVFSSESCAFDLIGAEYIRDVEPGEFIIVRNGQEMESSRISYAPRKAHCVFELVYFARPDSLVFGESVYEVRKRFGARMAAENPVDADVVMPIPDGGMFAALGYAEAAGIPFDMGIMRNHYVGRTFIQPCAADRRTAVKIKLNPIRGAIEGKRVVLIDDSIVRGNTSRERVRLVRECGAREVHMRISCPPHVGGCHYGIDFPDPDALIANHHTINEIAELINVDSLAYLSLDGMLQSMTRTEPSDYCAACFTCDYPVVPKLGNGKAVSGKKVPQARQA